MSDAIVRQVLDFWFLPEGDARHGTFRKRWFVVSPAFDAEVASRFAGTWEDAAFGRLNHLTETPDGSLALVLILDQFPRNIFRGTPRAFATDAQAYDVAEAAIARGFDRHFQPVQRMFLYLPFEHSEVLADQERCVALMTELGDAMAIDYAVRHRDIIARFGRFPHRNAILGRPSTIEEIAFLAQANSSF